MTKDVSSHLLWRRMHVEYHLENRIICPRLKVLGGWSLSWAKLTVSSVWRCSTLIGLNTLLRSPNLDIELIISLNALRKYISSRPRSGGKIGRVNMWERLTLNPQPNFIYLFPFKDYSKIYEWLLVVCSFGSESIIIIFDRRRNVRSTLKFSDNKDLLN